ncbi:MAG TPA: hypothetical protein DDX09_09195 [Hyphomonas atlantica]|nr:hypothetical protein [Hyphomonas atlantica]
MKRTLAVLFASTAMIASPAAAKNSGGAWTPEPGDVIEFDVLRKGKPFGSHSVTFGEDSNGRLTARTDVLLKAGLGPITVFKYELDATEVWQNGQLVSLNGEVNDDGKEGQVTATRAGNELNVDGTQFEGRVATSIIPSSHWNFAATQATELLSTEDGEILDVSVSEQGKEVIVAAGEEVEATRYLLDSDIDVTLWYDEAGRWLKLAFEARGQDIEYVLTKPY